MKVVHGVEFHSGSKEEKLPDFTSDFPYISSRAELDNFRECSAPWHWHKAIELFYMESGELEYYTPGGTTLFRAGSGGMVNSNVLHMTKILKKNNQNVQLHHIFDPSFVAGGSESKIAQKYVTPLITAPHLEIIPLYPDNPAQADILGHIRRAFALSESDFGYEIKIREALSEIWLKLYKLSYPSILDKTSRYDKSRDKIKSMMIYIHEHYAEKITVQEIASAAFSSERECYRVFQTCLHMTPIDYIRNYRLQIACQKLADGPETITQICQSCGLGSSSYFGKIFREYMGMTPLEYRHRWQDSNIN